MSQQKLEEFVCRSKGSFDSSLSTQGMGPGKNASLKIQLRVCFLPVPAGKIEDFNGTEWETPGWTDNGFRAFRHVVKQFSESFFNNRFWLVTPFQYDWLDYAPIGQKPYRCHVECQFELITLRNPQWAHHVVRVVNFPPNDERYKSFRSDAGTWDIYDMVETRNRSSKGTIHIQYPYLHEIGHLLGIDHPGVGNGVCKPWDGDGHCYEGNSSQQTDSLAGMGMGMTDREAQPWTNRMFEHTGVRASAWKVSTSPIRPQPLFGATGHAMPSF